MPCPSIGFNKSPGMPTHQPPQSALPNAPKSFFDVPVFVQPSTSNPLSGNRAFFASRPRGHTASDPQRTASDFSFGSGNEEMEFVWRRDFQPETLNPQPPQTPTQQLLKMSSVPAGYTLVPSSSSHDRDFDGRFVRPLWVDASTGNPLYGMSKSTVDLRPGRHRRSKHRRPARKRRRPETSAMGPPATAYLSSSGSDNPPPGGFIPVWYPTLPCVGELKPSCANLEASPENDNGDSSASVLSADGTYDFPSEYSSCGQYYVQSERRRSRSRSRSCSRSRSRSRSHRRRDDSWTDLSMPERSGCTCDYTPHHQHRDGRRRHQHRRSRRRIIPREGLIGTPRSAPITWTHNKNGDDNDRTSSPDLSDIEVAFKNSLYRCRQKRIVKPALLLHPHPPTSARSDPFTCKCLNIDCGGLSWNRSFIKTRICTQQPRRYCFQRREDCLSYSNTFRRLSFIVKELLKAFKTIVEDKVTFRVHFRWG